MSHYKPYPAYKDSGVEWLGKVPDHWISKKLMYWISTGYGSGTTPSDESYYVSDESGVAWVTTGELRENTINKTEKYVTERALTSHSALKVHPAGSLIIAMYGATIGRLGVLGVNAALNQACFAIHPPKTIATTFLRYWFEGFRSELIELGAGGGQPNISADKIRNLVVSAPCSEDEQNKVIAHLDRETARIDALISKKSRFIELLREKRQALITHAVTKGLDPNVKMKDSGVEWLGEVPEHWNIKRLQFLCASIKAGPFGSALTKDMYVADGYRVYGQEQVIPGDFTIGDYYITPEYFSELIQYAVQPGDVLVSCVGTFGKIAVVPEAAEPGIINPRLIRIRVNRLISPLYLTVLMRSDVVFEQFSLWSRGGTMDVINIGTLSGIVLAVPPASEQDEILRYVNHEAERIDALVKKSVHSIELLKERRSALITAAVTGQIDLREAA